MMGMGLALVLGHAVRRCVPSLALLVVAVLGAPDPALADLYRWVDERGVAHFTQSLSSIPQRYRASAERLGSLPANPPTPLQPAPDPRVTRIRFTPGAQILVSAKVNGHGPITLVLDTGADRTTISPRALEQAGADPEKGVARQIRGVTGSAAVTVVQVESIEVEEARVGPMFVNAHDSQIPGSDGLLGRDFLEHFTVAIDPVSGVVTLTPR